MGGGGRGGYIRGSICPPHPDAALSARRGAAGGVVCVRCAGRTRIGRLNQGKRRRGRVGGRGGEKDRGGSGGSYSAMARVMGGGGGAAVGWMDRVIRRIESRRERLAGTEGEERRRRRRRSGGAEKRRRGVASRCRCVRRWTGKKLRWVLGVGSQSSRISLFRDLRYVPQYRR